MTTQVPSLYADEFQTAVENFKQRNNGYVDWLDEQLKNPVFSDQLLRTWFGSQYARNVCGRRPELFKVLVDDNDFTQSISDKAFAERLVLS